MGEDGWRSPSFVYSRFRAATGCTGGWQVETVARRDQFNRRYKRNKDALEWLEAVALAVVAVALVFTFGVRMIRVDGESMLPTLQDGERLLISSLPYEPAYGDIIIIDQYTEYGEPLVKRVIGIGGDTIDIDFQAGVVYRNGEPLDEPYTAEPTYLQESVTFPVTVPQGCLFVMGDNRNHSTDSRDTRVGFIDVRDVLGRVLL